MDATNDTGRRGPNGSGPSVRELVEESQRVRDDLVRFAGAARHAVHGWESLLRDRLERRPYATLGIAAGIGYILGGGLPLPLVRVLAGIGGRLAVERAIAQFASPSEQGPS